MNYDDVLRKTNAEISGSCPKGKTGFGNKSRAKHYMKFLQSKHGLQLRVYRCPLCNLFHLTSKKERM